jgi:signal transduction histidine kinase
MPPDLPDDTLLLLNRGTVVMHTVRSAAHELNNVLQMISGAAEMMELNPDFPSSMRPRLTSIANQTSRGRDLVATLGELARTAVAPPGGVADVRRAIEQVAQLRKFEHSRGGVDLEIVVPRNPPLVARVNPPELQLMLLNLVINAEQAIAQAPTKLLTVTAKADGATCQIVVGDSGQGTAAGADYFAPFYSTRGTAGLGLGATRLLAGRHGGTVAIRQGPAGVESVLTLPAAAR